MSNNVSISEANQNFSKVARLCNKKGEVIVYKNNKPCFLIKKIEEDVDSVLISDCQKIEKIYDECKEIITPSFETRFHSSLLNDTELKKFFICVADFFLQLRQESAIKSERY